jgi:hypothetical protein
VLLGADGVAVRVGRHESDLDGLRRRADRRRKILPWRRVATYGTAVVLVTLGVLLFAAPHAIPTLTVPSADQMTEMESMHP